MATESVPVLLDELEREMSGGAADYNHTLADAVRQLIRVCRIQNAQIAELWALIPAPSREE